VQPLEFPELADPSQEVLVRVQPSFIQLAAVPVIEDPSAIQQPPGVMSEHRRPEERSESGDER
jgi:hypothetical protein